MAAGIVYQPLFGTWKRLTEEEKAQVEEQAEIDALLDGQDEQDVDVTEEEDLETETIPDEASGFWINEFNSLPLEQRLVKAARAFDRLADAF